VRDGLSEKNRRVGHRHAHVDVPALEGVGERPEVGAEGGGPDEDAHAPERRHRPVSRPPAVRDVSVIEALPAASEACAPGAPEV
jgi:hypothetical protein